jgi:hypothetical protein
MVEHLRRAVEAVRIDRVPEQGPDDAARRWLVRFAWVA